MHAASATLRNRQLQQSTSIPRTDTRKDLGMPFLPPKNLVSTLSTEPNSFGFKTTKYNREEHQWRSDTLLPVAKLQRYMHHDGDATIIGATL